MMWFLQMAQLSTTISQAHNATAFHWVTVSGSQAKSKEEWASLDLLHLELLLSIDEGSSLGGGSLLGGALVFRCRRSIDHVNVCHCGVKAGSAGGR